MPYCRYLVANGNGRDHDFASAWSNSHKPGSATLPFFGIKPVLLSDDGDEISENNTSGFLAIKSSWPGQMRTVYGDHQRFKETYFSQFEGYYFTGDGAFRDEDGYYWITGRVMTY
ncbi:MAG: hypothetical protein Ct9H90mP20_3140 [Candidatus Neomarinimicrobiota bacterium]|nr:MAG: hypothetical protein Ct9H90mP20_3140 [Candidatus Neomarinimicrobiota bacterium]